MRSRARGGAADPESTRAALVEAGRELFAERGFKGATVERIARRARANKAMIHYHFGSKKGLYQALLGATLDEIVARLRDVRAADRPAPEQLRQFVEVFAALASSHASFPRMLVRELVSGGENVGREVVARMVSVWGVLREIVEQGVREGSFRKVDPTLTHVSIVGALVFFFATEPFRRRAFAGGLLPVPLPRNEDFVAHLQELILRGLAPTDPVRRKS